MDKNIIYSSSQAEMINDEAAKKIAHHIIITSHYNPDAKYLSSDALYLAGIQNLYKFLIDSGIASKLTKLENISSIGKRFKNNKRIVGILRTKTCHNKNEVNDIGMVEEQYTNWIKSVIKKDEPVSSDDFEMLKIKLMNIGQELVDDIIKFIDESSKRNKQKTAEKIEELWIEYYNSLSGQEIIRKQLWDYYVIFEREVYANYSWRDKENRLKSFCERYYCGDLLDRIKRNENLISIYGAKLKKDDLIKLQEELSCDKEKYALKREAAEKCGGFCSYYISDVINDKIAREIQAIKNDPDRTLMPEDLIQNIIERDFGRV